MNVLLGLIIVHQQQHVQILKEVSHVLAILVILEVVQLVMVRLFQFFLLFFLLTHFLIKDINEQSLISNKFIRY